MVEATRSEVAVHLTSTRGGFLFQVRIGIELRKKFLDIAVAEGKCHGLVAVVAGSEVAVGKGMGQGNLCDFLAIAKNAELGLAREHFLAAEITRLAALMRYPKVVQDHILGKWNCSLCAFLTGYFSHTTSLE